MKEQILTFVICTSLVACAGTGGSPDAANSAAGHGATGTAGHDEPIDLLPRVTGSYGWKISTDIAAAQAYFNQGMQLRFAYGVDEAARSMAEARRQDPSCAMCYWGEAFALGSYLNGGMSKANAPHARAAILKANELADANSSSFERDLPCAEILGSSIPGASHINHMPSHTFNELGMWGKSVRANTRAWHSDLKAAVNEGVAIYPPHNLHMLLFSASMDGQGAVATQAGKDYAKLAGNSMYEVLTLIRFGRFVEALKNDDRPGDGVSGAVWDFAHGYASLREGDRKTAITMRDRVLEFAAVTDAKFRFHPAGLVVGTVGHILEGEIYRDRGDLDAAIAALKKAVAAEDQLDYDEPEPLPFAARHWLGAALLEAGRNAEAEKIYRDELEQHPHNGWSLIGLRQALAAQGRNDASVDADLERSWARSDTWTQASRF